MTTVNETPSSSGTLQFRQGALDAAQIRGECPRFRILVIGKANAGKTTILRKVCNAKSNVKPTTYDGEGKEVSQEATKSRFSLLSKIFGQKGHVLKPSTESGEHNIEHQLTYPGSNFIFHDSRGIESGSENELKIVKNFIQKRGQLVDLKDQLHVIWYCVPMDDERPISGAEKAFFSLGTGRVPVVLIFTKFDALEHKCYSELREQGKSYKVASTQAPELAYKTFQEEYLPHILNAEFPPKTYVCLAEMNKEKNQCPELSEKTIGILDDNVLVNLFVLTQKNNLDLCIDRGIRNVWKHGNFQKMYIISGLLPWFPNFWNSSGYKPMVERVALTMRWPEVEQKPQRQRASRPSWMWVVSGVILKILSQQFPCVFSQDTSGECGGLINFQAIAVVALLAEHSFWFSGSNMEEQFPHAIKSFKSQKHTNITIVKEEIEIAFNRSSHKEDPAWLIHWVINNKLEHQ